MTPTQAAEALSTLLREAAKIPRLEADLAHARASQTRIDALEEGLRARQEALDAIAVALGLDPEQAGLDDLLAAIRDRPQLGDSGR